MVDQDILDPQQIDRVGPHKCRPPTLIVHEDPHELITTTKILNGQVGRGGNYRNAHFDRHAHEP